jgi:predicted Rossmann-fold nucleotide-binding protein
VRTVDAVIAVGGEFGTLSEIALALRMAKPVVGLATWALARRPDSPDPVIRANSPAEAVRQALQAARATRRHD